jgi:hypothetical protein
MSHLARIMISATLAVLFIAPIAQPALANISTVKLTVITSGAGWDSTPGQGAGWD